MYMYMCVMLTIKCYYIIIIQVFVQLIKLCLLLIILKYAKHKMLCNKSQVNYSLRTHMHTLNNSCNPCAYIKG